uniref:L-lactate dehydrogenase n=1 Tax=Ananas comosus var. bracteatus TaxID=296719 RepID=A0A6V7PJT5_ANACO|nr:unnamed protein product [Ananas comosus var. bracteatus]
MVGEHGDSSVALWSSISIGGVPMLSSLRESDVKFEQAVLERIRKAVVGSAYEVIRLKGYTSWAIGYSVASLARSLLRNQHRIHPSPSSPAASTASPTTARSSSASPPSSAALASSASPPCSSPRRRASASASPPRPFGDSAATRSRQLTDQIY